MIFLFEEFKYQQDIDLIINEIKKFLKENKFPRNKWIYFLII